MVGVKGGTSEFNVIRHKLGSSVEKQEGSDVLLDRAKSLLNKSMKSSPRKKLRGNEISISEMPYASIGYRQSAPTKKESEHLVSEANILLDPDCSYMIQNI